MWGATKEEAHLDGKYIISTSDDTLTPEDIALGYRQLMEVVRAFRFLKTTLDLRHFQNFRLLRCNELTHEAVGQKTGRTTCRETSPDANRCLQHCML